MQRYFSNITATNGSAVPGASVTVRTAAGSLATIYTDDGVNATSNPLTTDVNGFFAFYAANGDYTLSITGTGIATQTITGIQLLDVDDATGSASVGFLQSGTDAVARTVQAKGRDVVSVKDFGAVGDGVTDDTAAIQAAVLAHPNKTIVAPPGTYKLTAGIVLAAGQVLVGAGINNTIFSCADAFDAVTLSSDYSGVASCSFTSAAARTANAYVRLSSATRGNSVRSIKATNAFYGIHISAAAVITWIDSIEMANIAPTTGVGIYINGGNDTLISNVVMDNPSGSQPLAGIRINKTDAVWLNSVDMIHCGTGLLCDPQGATDYITWLFVENSAFDTGSSHGVSLAPANASAVIRGCTFVGSWTSTNSGNGFSISGSGTVKGLRLVGHRSFNNTLSGYVVAGSSTSTDLNFTGCDASGNSAAVPGTYSGFDIGANVSGFTIQNCRSGQMAGFGNTQNRGIIVNPGTSDKYVIAGNDLRLNTTALFDGGTGTNKQIAFNIGDAEMTSSVRGLSIVSGNGSAGALQLTDTGGSGVNIKLTGDGGTTPSKYIRATGGNLQVVNSAYGAVILGLADAGTLQSAGGMQPGTPALAIQTACTLYAGTGVPNNANGINGDMYFRSDGGAGTTVYQKRAGAWAGIV